MNVFPLWCLLFLPAGIASLHFGKLHGHSLSVRNWDDPLVGLDSLISSQQLRNLNKVRWDYIKERVDSEMKICLLKKGILVIVPIKFISFRFFCFSDLDVRVTVR